MKPQTNRSSSDRVPTRQSGDCGPPFVKNRAATSSISAPPEGELAVIRETERVVVIHREVTLRISKSEWAEFEGWVATRPVRASYVDRPHLHINDCILSALIFHSPVPGEWTWSRPFNKPWGQGIASDKVRTAASKKRVAAEPRWLITFPIGDEIYRRCVARAEMRGVTLGEHLLTCVSYYAALWRRDQPKPKPSPFQLFERSLAKEHRVCGTPKHKRRLLRTEATTA